jgi:ABC-2 type transport system permease protein
METQTYKPQSRSKLFFAISDTGVLIKRSLMHISKNLDQLLSIIISPVMFMLLFRYVFGGAIETGGVTYVNYLVAGILVQTAAFGATTTSLSVATDLKKGIVERLKTLPIVSSGVLMGHVVADLVRNVLSAIVMIGIAYLVGFKPNASVLEWFQIAGILLIFTFAFSWLSAIMGLVAKSVEATQWIGFVIVFPLTFASSAFVPTSGMPSGLRFFAENQPVTHVIEAIRALMIGTPIGNHGILAVVWCAGFTLIAIPLVAYLFRRIHSK